MSELKLNSVTIKNPADRQDLSVSILSDIIHYMKYGRYIPDFARRELFEDTTIRNRQMHLERYPELRDEIIEAYQYVLNKTVLPSMRSMQFAGKPIQMSPNRMYNCAYTAMDDWRVFGELMFLLLGGTGVGFSVQKHHVAKLPAVRGQLTRKRRFLVPDSLEGWAETIKVLMKSYFYGKSKPVFDYSDIREKGSILITSGGKAPGPQPLKDCVYNISKIMDGITPGNYLKPIEVYDIANHIADAVLAGGIRRAAMITLFSFDDEEMLYSKSGTWYELNPQRGRSNNTAVALRYRITEEEFRQYFRLVENNRTGEPGIMFSNDSEMGLNPCAEISLYNNGFCNLTTTNVSNIKDQEDLNNRVRAAAFIATLQAGYTDFHYLRNAWKNRAEKDALIGVSMTGIASGRILDMDLKEAARVVNEENVRVAKLIGINKADRTTAIKPEGSGSLLLGTSSGIHAWYDKYYIRRVRVAKNEAIYEYLKEYHPELLEDEHFAPDTQAIIKIPQKAPDGAITRDESVFDLLDRVRRFNEEWVTTGHRKGANHNNVSVTVTIKDDEWSGVGDWMWTNRNSFTAISVLPYDGGTYIQPPYETIDEDTYNEMVKSLKEVDLSKVIEDRDNTTLIAEAACSGGSCEVI